MVVTGAHRQEGTPRIEQESRCFGPPFVSIDKPGPLSGLVGWVRSDLPCLHHGAFAVMESDNSHENVLETVNL